MSDVDRLLAQFKADFEAGGTMLPSDVLARVEGSERRELEALIDGYLVHAPRRAFDRAAFAASPAADLAEELATALEVEANTWHTVLPRLRHAAQLSRANLVARLTEALGVPGQEEKVAVYYHRMERGALEPTGVSQRVLSALAQLLGSTVERLREASSALAHPPTADAAFARSVEHDDEHAAMLHEAPVAARARARATDDEVDRLFTGGWDA
jgi:hypothetical protein